MQRGLLRIAGLCKSQQDAMEKSTRQTYLRAKVSVVSQPENWEWMREELRKGNPVVAGLVSDYWRVLPAAFFAHHRAPPIDSGHAVEQNGGRLHDENETLSAPVLSSW